MIKKIKARKTREYETEDAESTTTDSASEAVSEAAAETLDEIERALSECAPSKSIEDELREAHEQWRSEMPDAKDFKKKPEHLLAWTAWRNQWQPRRDAIYAKHGIDREKFRENQGCACNCPAYL